MIFVLFGINLLPTIDIHVFLCIILVTGLDNMKHTDTKIELEGIEMKFITATPKKDLTTQNVRKADVAFINSTFPGKNFQERLKLMCSVFRDLDADAAEQADAISASLLTKHANIAEREKSQF